MTARLCIVGETPEAAAWCHAARALRHLELRECPADRLGETLRDWGGANLLIPCLSGGEIARLPNQLEGLAQGVLLPADVARHRKQAESLRKNLRRVGIQGLIAHRLCFLPAVNRLAELATAGMLGELRDITLELSWAATPAARHQEALMFACLLTGEPVATPAGMDDAGTLELRTPHGVRLQLALRTPQPGAAETFQAQVGGTAARAVAAWASAPGAPGTVDLRDEEGRERRFHVAAGEPRRLCLASAVLALRLGGAPHPALDLQLAGKLLPAG